MSMIMAAMVFLTIGTGYVQAQDKTSDSASELPKVYLIKEITPENLVKIYETLGRKAEGKPRARKKRGDRPHFDRQIHGNTGVYRHYGSCILADV